MLKIKDLTTNKIINIKENEIDFIIHEKDHIAIVKKDYTEYKTKFIKFEA